MDQQKSSGNYWLRFLGWMIFLVALIIFYPQLLWIEFPGIFTNFALELKLM